MVSKPAAHSLGLVLEEVTLCSGNCEALQNVSSLVLCLERLFFLITQKNRVFSSPMWFRVFCYWGFFLFVFLQHAGA